jgi:hypothetical protein
MNGSLINLSAFVPSCASQFPKNEPILSARNEVGLGMSSWSSVFTKGGARRWRGFSSSTTCGLAVWTTFARKTTAHLGNPQNSVMKFLFKRVRYRITRWLH